MWRHPVPRDEGEEYLIKSPDLVEPDVNPNGISVGVIQTTAYGWMATCATWCPNMQDHWHSVEIEGVFLIADMPTE